MTERFSIFYAPATEDPLWRRAAQWLGRDAAGGAVPAAAIPGIDARRRHEVTDAARRYGFHATLKPPMVLAKGTDEPELMAALAAFAAARRPVPIGRLRVASLGDFLALMPEVQGDELTAFAADCVVAFERFRAPPSSEERARRLEGGLSPRHIELLDRYGYPYVLDEFRFHMTVTDRLTGPDRDDIVAAAEAWFAPLLDRPYSTDRLVLFHEAGPGAAFTRRAEAVLGAGVAADA